MNKRFFFFLCAIAALFLLSSLDLPLASFLYRDGQWSNTSFTAFFYRFAPFPSLILSILSAFSLIFYFFFPKFFKLRAYLFCFLLTMSLGSGVLVHAVFKEHWGRARPKQLVQFGGEEPFSPFYIPGKVKEGVKKRSFPCGHATCGFVFFAFSEYYRRKERYFLSFIWALTSLSLGLILGYARMAVGGHFLSDVLVSGFLMYLTAYASAFWTLKKPHLSYFHFPFFRKPIDF